MMRSSIPPSRASGAGGALVIAASLAGALSACSAAPQERAYVGVVEAQAPGQTLSAPVTPASAAAATAALALPSEAGSPLRITEKRYANGWRQSQSLSAKRLGGDWSDLSLDVQYAPPVTPSGSIPMGKPSKAGVRGEILARFPGVAMRIVERPMSNALGPFGIAVGAGAGGVRCAFAWQWIDDLHVAPGAPAAASIRMRLCRAGVTADQLASFFERLQLADASVVAAAVEAGRAKADDAPQEALADQTSLEATLAPTLRAAHAPPRAKRLARRRAPAPAERQEPALAPAPTVTLAPQAANGRQYLAPIGGASAPVHSHGAGFGEARLDPGLPAQAYRGPQSR